MDAGVVDQHLDRANLQQGREGVRGPLPVGDVEGDRFGAMTRFPQYPGQAFGPGHVPVGVDDHMKTGLGQPLADGAANFPAASRHQCSFHGTRHAIAATMMRAEAMMASPQEMVMPYT